MFIKTEDPDLPAFYFDPLINPIAQRSEKVINYCVVFILLYMCNFSKVFFFILLRCRLKTNLFEVFSLVDYYSYSL